MWSFMVWILVTFIVSISSSIMFAVTRRCLIQWHIRDTIVTRRLGMTLDVAVEKLNLAGQMQIILNMNMDCPFPHVSDATFSFIEK